MPLMTIARLTLHEALRRRLLLAVALLTLVFVILTGWGFSRMTGMTDNNGLPLSPLELQATEAGFVVLLAWMFSFVLAIGAAFLAAPSIAADIESGLMLALLPRPIRRSDLLLGKWLGLAVLLALYAAVTGALEFAVVQRITGYAPPNPLLALVYLIAESLVMLSLAMLCSTRMAPITGGIIGVLVFGLAWIGGVLGSIGASLHNTSLNTVSHVFNAIVPTDGLWHGALYYLEPPIIFIAANGFSRDSPFSADSPPSTPSVLWAACWTVAALALAVVSFSRRDL